MFTGTSIWIAKLRKEGDLRKMFFNTGWLVADKGLRMAMSLIVGVWVARYFGPANFGIYSYSIAFIAIFNAVATLGIDGLVVRDLVNKPQNANSILGGAFLLRAVSGVVAILLTLVAIVSLKSDDPVTVYLVSIIAASFVMLPVDVIDLFFQSRLASKYTIIARLSSLTIVNLLRVAAVLLSLSLLYFGVIQVIEAFLSAIFLLIIYKYTGGKVTEWRLDLKYAKDLFRSSYGLLADSVFVILNMQIDRLIIEYYHNDYEVGLYSVSVTLSQLWYFIPVFIGASTAPLLINKYQQGLQTYRKALTMIFRIMTYFSFAIAIFFTFFSSVIIEFLYGRSFSDAAPILTVYIWTCVLVFHVSIRSRSLIIEDGSKYIGWFSVVMTILNIILNFILVPRFAGIGAAISSISAWSVSVLLLPLFFRRTRNYPIYFFRSFSI